MVWPSTKCEPSSRIAWRVASRTVGRPSRLTRLSTIFSGVSPGWITRAVTPSVQAEAETRKAPEVLRPPTSRRRRACPRSAGRRSRRRARAAAPRPAPSGRGPPWSRANRRAGSPRCRRGRRSADRIASTSRRARASMRASAASPRDPAASRSGGDQPVWWRIGRGKGRQACTRRCPRRCARRCLGSGAHRAAPRVLGRPVVDLFAVMSQPISMPAPVLPAATARWRSHVQNGYHNGMRHGPILLFHSACSLLCCNRHRERIATWPAHRAGSESQPKTL